MGKGWKWTELETDDKTFWNSIFLKKNLLFEVKWVNFGYYEIRMTKKGNDCCFLILECLQQELVLSLDGLYLWRK